MIQANALHIPLKDESVQCVITSPPYWGLRDYGTATWEGGKDGCDHSKPQGAGVETSTLVGSKGNCNNNYAPKFLDFCGNCGAKRIDNQLGLEKTPEEYEDNTVKWAREVWRVLRNDGTFWLNLGDSYAGSGKAQGQKPDSTNMGKKQKDRPYDVTTWTSVPDGLKPKDLCGIPWSVVKALQAPYYTGKIKDEKDRVWLAAMIDAEGTICGFFHNRKDDGGIRTGIHINITNSNESILKEAFRIYPEASKHVHQKLHTDRYGSRPMWRWHVFSIEGKQNLICEIYPYLIAKRKQAVVAYNFLELQKDAKRLGKSGEAEKIKAIRKFMVETMSKLNHAENIDLPSWMKEPHSLYESGWWLRSAMPWVKRSAMPESCTDRPASALEYMFLLTKSQKYYFDMDAIKKNLSQSSIERISQPTFNNQKGGAKDPRNGGEGSRNRSARQGLENLKESFESGNGRNFRNTDLFYQSLEEPHGAIFCGDEIVGLDVNPQAYKEAHFATFPEKLVEPLIKAGTSERGACPECGAPWKRIIEKEHVGDNTGKRNDNPRNGIRGSGLARPPQTVAHKEFLGWQPTCSHKAEPVPCVILDPFGGSGTTKSVADRLGRQGVICELKMEYIEMAKDRCYQEPSLF